MRFIQIGHPGTTTPFPPCATDGGWSTKQLKSCRRISCCSAQSNSDFFTDGSLRFSEEDGSTSLQDRVLGSTIVAAVRPEPHLDRLQSSRRPSATFHGAARTTFE